MTLLEPEHLAARAEAESQLGNDGRASHPSTARRCGDQVAKSIGDVEVDGIPTVLYWPNGHVVV